MSDTFGVLVNLSPYHAMEEGIAWITALKERAEHEELKFYLALPFDILNAIASNPSPSFLMKGGQSLSPVKAGAFTESIASRLLRDLGAQFVLLGTRRARKVEEESNETIREKIKKAKEGGLIPILCIGETAEEFQKEQSAEVLTRQIGEATFGLDAAELAGLQVVYEAPWVNEVLSRPSVEEIDHAYQFCRGLVHSLCGEPLASTVKVYCPVPFDLKNADSFIHSLHADGFYFCDPHQLAAIDEASLRAKASTARKAREVVETIATVEAEPIVEEKPAKKVRARKKVEPEKAEPENEGEGTAELTETEEAAVSEVISEADETPAPKKTRARKKAAADGEAEGAAMAEETAPKKARKKKDEEVVSESEQEKIDDAGERLALNDRSPELDVEDQGSAEAAVEAEAPTEAVPEEEAPIEKTKGEEGVIEVKVDDLTGTVSKVRKSRKKTDAQ